ncbi:hypothetical protein [Streptomyces sp. NPDC002587]
MAPTTQRLAEDRSAAGARPGHRALFAVPPHERRRDCSRPGQLPNNGPLGQVGEALSRDHSGSRRPGTVRPSSVQRAISAL